MRIDIATLFTQMCGSVLNESIVGRGIRNGFIEVHTHDIRKYTENISISGKISCSLIPKA